jgi:hypothetical protein
MNTRRERVLFAALGFLIAIVAFKVVLGVAVLARPYGAAAWKQRRSRSG